MSERPARREVVLRRASSAAHAPADMVFQKARRQDSGYHMPYCGRPRTSASAQRPREEKARQGTRRVGSLVADWSLAGWACALIYLRQAE